MKKGHFLPIVVIVLSFLLFWAGLATGQEIPQFKITRLNADGILTSTGDLHLDINWKMPANADYIAIKRLYPSPYILLRDVVSGRSSFFVENAKAEYKDATNSIVMSADFKGAAVLRRQRWEVDMGRDMELVWQEGQRVILLQILPLGSMFMVGKYNIRLPQEATNIKYSIDSGLLTFSMPIPQVLGKPQLEVKLKCKPRIAASVYKVYGNKQIGNGTFWAAKTVFMNTGKSSVRDLEVRYRISGYADWSPSSKYSTIVPGGTVVDLYYPIISPKAAELRTETPVDLEVEYSYKDEAGHVYRDSDSARISILGINQFEFSNILPEENTGTWTDNFSNAPLLAAFVTRLDDPVKAFAGMASQLAGGAAASSSDDDALTYCKALYDLEVAHGISYQTPSGFLVEYSGGQDIKYPRDVLRDRSGTCVDLAITYAAACEAVGLRAYLLVIPGHVYPLIELPSGQILPVETTGVAGAAVGKSVTFEEAVKIGQKNLPKDLNEKPHFLVDLREMWRQGVSSPELPRLDADVLQRWGYKLPTGSAASQQQIPQPQAAQQSLPPVADLSGTYRGTVLITKGPAAGKTGYVMIMLQQNGASIRGQFMFDLVPPAQGSGPLEGQVQGNQLNFRMTVMGIAYEFQGVIQGNTIQGRFQSIQTGEAGEFYINKSS
ncbi:MAG: transglutaminase domain-containing protein [Firmicutes bacterium]|nr:transglutaminase domain-containing protein [Bacillota bacterium]